MGDGKTVLKGGYGRFNQLRELQPDVTGINSNTSGDDDLGLARQQRQQAVRSRRGQPRSERAGLPVGPLGAATLGRGQPERETAQDRRVLGDLRAGAGREHGGASDRGVFAKLQYLRAVRASAATGSTRFRSRIAIRGPMARLGTADDTGESFTYYEYPIELGRRRDSRPAMFTNEPARITDFKTFEVAVMKRPVEGLAARRVVLEHVDRHPGCVAAPRAQGSASQFDNLVSDSVRNESQPGVQHGQ